MKIAVRRVREADLPRLARLFDASVRALAPEYYAPSGVEAWAAFSEEAGFRDFILDPVTLVAEDESGVIGFAGIDETGCIRSLFVRPDRARQGIGSRLLEALLSADEDRMEFWANASDLSRPLFERFGFVVVETEVVARLGAKLRRYRMERRPRATEFSAV